MNGLCHKSEIRKSEIFSLGWIDGYQGVLPDASRAVGVTPPPSFRGARSANPESLARQDLWPDGFRICVPTRASRNDEGAVLPPLVPESAMRLG